MAYLLDTGTLAEVLRSVPSRNLVRRLTTVPARDRWTSVITVSQILVAARKTRNPKVMQDVIRLVAAVKVAAVRHDRGPVVREVPRHRRPRRATPTT